MFSLEELQKMDKNELIKIIGNYISDQEIWMNQVKGLEKQIDDRNAEIEQLTEEKKPTDEEIVKSLECCLQNETKDTCEYCLSCPASDWYSEDDSECVTYMMKKAIDLINRQKAEIERLTEELDEMFDRHAKENQVASILIEKRNNEIVELKKQVDELKGGKGLFISQDQIDWVCSLGVMVHIEEDSPVVLLNRHKYENTCADYDRRIFHFEEEKEQAVKDTAKKYHDIMEREFMKSNNSNFYKFWCNFNDNIIKGFGVEVTE